jgi:hypothetical protein
MALGSREEAGALAGRTPVAAMGASEVRLVHPPTLVGEDEIPAPDETTRRWLHGPIFNQIDSDDRRSGPEVDGGDAVSPQVDSRGPREATIDVAIGWVLTTHSWRPERCGRLELVGFDEVVELRNYGGR